MLNTPAYRSVNFHQIPIATCHVNCLQISSITSCLSKWTVVFWSPSVLVLLTCESRNTQFLHIQVQQTSLQLLHQGQSEFHHLLWASCNRHFTDSHKAVLCAIPEQVLIQEIIPFFFTPGISNGLLKILRDDPFLHQSLCNGSCIHVSPKPFILILKNPQHYKMWQ